MINIIKPGYEILTAELRSCRKSNGQPGHATKARTKFPRMENKPVSIVRYGLGK